MVYNATPTLCGPLATGFVCPGFDPCSLSTSFTVCRYNYASMNYSTLHNSGVHNVCWTQGRAR